MAFFHIENDANLTPIKQTQFKLEKEIQSLTEGNLHSIFGLEFVSTEFTLKQFRIDTLAFDPNTSSFVIIEYKRDRSFSVIDQGFSYLSLLLNHKADFVLHHNEVCKKSLRKDDVDWSQSRVIFVSPQFTQYQREATNFKDLPIELWEINTFENQTVSYTKIQTIGSKESIKTVSGANSNILDVSKEIKVYSEDEHLSKASDDIKELYEQLRNAILAFGNVNIKPTKGYIAFVHNSNFTDVHIQKNGLKIWVNMLYGSLDDPKKIGRNVSSIGHWGNGDYEIKLHNDDDIEYVLSLIKQSYKQN